MSLKIIKEVFNENVGFVSSGITHSISVIILTHVPIS